MKKSDRKYCNINLPHLIEQVSINNLDEFQNCDTFQLKLLS